MNLNSENNKNEKFLSFILERFPIERKRFDRSGVYAFTQRLLAYNSNKIEGSTLTEEQTASLFDTGILPKTEDYYRVKDVEEMNGHFLMFNKMLDTLQEPLTQQLIKAFHFELKSGVFEDRANGYAIGDYKKRPNIVGNFVTVSPQFVESEMSKLLDWYDKQTIITVDTLAELHARYEEIHPFQDGNGRTGRIIIFRECLKNNMIPIVIEDLKRHDYIEALKEYHKSRSIEKISILFKEEQQFYYDKCKYFLF